MIDPRALAGLQYCAIKKVNACMYKQIFDQISLTAAPAIRAIAEAASRMPVTTKAFWATRLNHVYGDMGGQRAVSLAEVVSLKNEDSHFDLPGQTDLVVALETYYSLICLLLASASLKRSPEKFILETLSGSRKDTLANISNLINGKSFEQYGIYGFRNSLDLAWLPDTLSERGLEKVVDSLSTLSRAWEGQRLLIDGLDPLQRFHKAILPKNLMHITGQFYSPEWLAQLLVDDMGYSGEGRLIDPFCGSGVFLLVALEKARANGVPVSQALKNILGVDLSPSACVAARSNMVIWLSQHLDEIEEPIGLNILNADSITPAITKGRASNDEASSKSNQICVDGAMLPLTHEMLSDLGQYTEALRGYGMELSGWSKAPNPSSSRYSEIGARDRRIAEQLFLFNIKPAEFLATNPPWVGWEYMSKPYRSEVQPAWDAYDLFSAKGLDAAFLKEDLSTLAMVSSWDLYLGHHGKTVAVLKPSTMKADLTGRGIRRLSLRSNSLPMRLEKVREFEGIKVFSDAQTETCSWMLKKGEETNFPVPVTIWKQVKRGWSPESSDNVSNVEGRVQKNDFLLKPTSSDDYGSRWLIAKDKQISEFSTIQGDNNYVPRMGVFTGGANAVFYLEKIANGVGSPSISTWSNIIHRAKRSAPKREVQLEDAIVRPVARGRDIEMWRVQPEVFMLFPHASETKMYPMQEADLSEKFPLAWKYLDESADILRSRKGFAGWEKKIHQEFFYTLQRIGEYTFSPYKVCWKYVCSEFTVCVLGGEEGEQKLIPNDKVMFIPFKTEAEAFYVGGILSSSIVRQYVKSCMSARQISTGIIRSVNIPDFDSANGKQLQISELCSQGHQLAKLDNFSELEEVRKKLDAEVEAFYRSLLSYAA